MMHVSAMLKNVRGPFSVHQRGLFVKFTDKLFRVSVASFVALGAVVVGSGSVAVANGTTCSFSIDGEPAEQLEIAIPPGLIEGIPDDVDELNDYLTQFYNDFDPATFTLGVTSTLVDPYVIGRIVFGSERNLLAEETGGGTPPPGLELPAAAFYFGVVQYVLSLEDDPIGFLRDLGNLPYRVEYDLLEGEGGPTKCSIAFIIGAEYAAGPGIAFDGFVGHYQEAIENSTLPATDSDLPATS